MQPLLLAAIFIEGYVVLATELLAIRQAIPVAGAGTDTIAIIIAAVLLPLAFGYHVGGAFKAGNIRRRLVSNLLIAAFILCFSLSMLMIEKFFFFLSNTLNIHHHAAQAAAYAVLFIAGPAYLLGQTIPLVSNFFSGKSLARATGKMLFFSTLGAFLGSVFTTIVLMTYIGVHNTVILNLFLIFVLIFLLSGKRQRFYRGAALVPVIIVFLLNNGWLMQRLNVVSDNSYSTIKIETYPPDDTRVLLHNNNPSSSFSDDHGAVFGYIRHFNESYIRPLMADAVAQDILVLGGGGMTVGYFDRQNNYTYVDIDPSTKDAAETYLIRQKLTPNKRFVAEDARAFLFSNDKKFDLIVIDTYIAGRAIPPQLVTAEFFAQVKAALKPGGRVAMNMLSCPHFEDVFSVRLDNTIRAVFPHVNRTIISDSYDAWSSYRGDGRGVCRANVIYSARRDSGGDAGTIYTDDRNSSFMDRKW